jgi:stress-induced morphogen
MTIQEIEEKLKISLVNSDVTVSSTRSMHRGHDHGGFHLKTIIKYDGFKNIPLLDQHRMIYNILEEEMNNGIIHALSIEVIND